MKQIKKMLVGLFGLLPMMVMADEVKVVYMTATTTNGKTVEARLMDVDGQALPRLYMIDNTVKINSVVYLKSEITSIRFSVKTETVDGIETVETDEEEDRSGAVYTLEGKLVRTDSRSMEGLPKGIYIINKKKIVVK